MKRIFFIFLALSFLSSVNYQDISSAVITTIVLDAGHGGKDPGASGTGRYKKTEKDIALDVTLKVGKYIEEAFKDIKVVYTRTEDTFPTLIDRTNLANKVNADLFISIHCDSFTKSSASGTSSHVMGLRYTKENLRIAQKENSVIYLEDNYEENYDGFDPTSPESIIALTLNQTTFLDQSILIAQKIQEQFKTRVNRKDRGVKQTPLWVTSRNSMPSVLVELGFISNPDEEDFLHSDQGQDYMASAIFRAFKEYKSELEALDGQDVFAPLKVGQKIEEQIEESKSAEEGVIYKVQIATSLKPTNFDSVNHLMLDFFRVDSFYKYTIGKTNSLDEVKDLRKIAIAKGFKDAFIIAYLNGNKISLKEAINFQNNLKNE